MSAPTDYESRKQLLEEIKKLSIDQYKELFRILKRNNVNFTENSNGVFFDLNSVSESTIVDIQQFVSLSQAQRNAEEERTNEMNTLRNETIVEEDS